ncbi:MAG: hypoxanthine phosphoribosyltransferase [Candidatus Bipolaricaulis anaerobius]|jgi:hypoxanthine phosphoribosyltransferase|nr:hypoxanthine phosphoribosyltransferase [Candidatus Bipolaricaulis anaerobius]MBP7726136.1 hypoxanthine phosphoribosyltransferase [Candidatus Bipolaricaulis sp.]MDD2912641.1 hypoxanthine phosphoribosyltransferase [Candidatus Bipolaricaulis anaerobius]MDD3748629.1 hypoxanthine phosphoribosyltransferase [Candidatus Bipolaricaulis anaerobius]MDD5763613.1 hypoxanthine phosphoribosyltransferase [Candidatus Bipolaricaulis anaerobius]
MDKIERVVISADEIARRVRDLGREIAADYRGGAGRDPRRRPLLVVGILKGAMPFMADLIRALDLAIEYDFMAVSSYGNGTSPGEVRILKDLDCAIGGRDVLLVEDIVDTGHTLHHLLAGLSARGPATLRVCTLLDKPHRREVEVTVDYVGFVLPENLFVVGYGLDYAEVYRNLPFVAILKPECIRDG